MTGPAEIQLRALPVKPGVYMFKDREGKVLYVGKATSLRHRVRSYFGPAVNLSPKTKQLAGEISDIEPIVTDSEQEALLLECNLIKKYRPRYNVLLKDDKSFPYLKIDLDNEWPGVRITRRFHKDKGRYFGPFASAGSVRDTLRLINRIFPFRSCNRNITGKDPRPCLEYYMHQCLGPCIGAAGREDYDEVIRQVIMFLEGKSETVLKEIRRKMEEASQQYKFERAAALRDQIQALQRVVEGQRIAAAVRGEQDVVAMVQTMDMAYVEIFFVRNNRLTGRDSLILEGVRDEEPGHIMTSFIKQYYSAASTIPPAILTQYQVEEPAVIARYLSNLKGHPVRLRVPRQGPKRHLMNIVVQNARQGLELYQAKQSSVTDLTATLLELKDELGLPQLPSRIEGYDISNIRGNLAVGSMVVFEMGAPRPSHYRRFKIKTVGNIDDYAMIQEVLRRRLKRKTDAGNGWSTVPDLILIDGGKGHLNAALQVREELGLDSIPVVSLAKEHEELFLPGKPGPVDVPRTSPALYLLERVRDEAHRFAVSYHRSLRHGQSLVSALDDIPGIGPRRKKALMKRFGSVPGIRNASVNELASVPGISPGLAERLKAYL